MQVWNVLHAARCKYRKQKSRQNRHLGTIAQLWRAISSQLRHISTIGKNLLSSNISSRCPHNMVNFGLLAAQILSLVWGTPANFNGFRVLAALLHGTLVVGVCQTAAFNRGRHLYSAGRPSGWALAHISSWHYNHAVVLFIFKSDPESKLSNNKLNFMHKHVFCCDEIILFSCFVCRPEYDSVTRERIDEHWYVIYWLCWEKFTVFLTVR